METTPEADSAGSTTPEEIDVKTGTPIESLTKLKEAMEKALKQVVEKLDNAKSSKPSSQESSSDEHGAPDSTTSVVSSQETIPKPLGIKWTADDEASLDKIINSDVSLPPELKLTPLQQGAIPKTKPIAPAPKRSILEQLRRDSRPLDRGSATKLSKFQIEDLIEEIKQLPCPSAKQDVEIVTEKDLDKENARRHRLDYQSHPKEKSYSSGRIKKTTDDRSALLAPSVTVRPAPVGELPKFNDVLRELGILKQGESYRDADRLYFTDLRVITDNELKQLVTKRAQILVTTKDANKVDVATQTYVTHAGKMRRIGCANCLAEGHQFQSCKLPYRPGFCHTCGAEGFDEADCIYPHGVEHERVLGRCSGCSGDLSLYYPECPDCNIRFEGFADWVRLNYATWPAYLIPAEHRILIGDTEFSMLKKRIKMKFDNQTDLPNKLRRVLIREKALVSAGSIANPMIPRPEELSQEKRERAIKALTAPNVYEHLDDVMKDRPELNDGQEVVVVIPTKYKKA